MKKTITISSALVLLAISCAPKTIAPTLEVPSQQNLALGKQIYENSCAKCHDLPIPTEHSPVQWVGIMNSMAPKAKLTAVEHQWVYDYVVSVK